MINNNFRYCIKSTEYGEYSCENRGCRDEGICRCYKINKIEIDSININEITVQILNQHKNEIENLSWDRHLKLFSIINDTSEKQVDIFYKFCINRILTNNKIWDKSNWICNWSNGYYGDEMESASIKDQIFEIITESISNIFKKQTISDIVQYLLIMEYGFILDKIKDKKYHIKDVNTKDVFFPQRNHHEKVLRGDLSYINISSPISDIQGVCIEENNRYSVIDGYHRLSYYKDKVEKIKIISIC